jgi:serine/threonine protein kinase
MFETVDGFALELEMMQHVNLFDHLMAQGHFPESHVRLIVGQLVDAVQVCNSAGVAHRDIKLSNITYPFPRLADLVGSSQQRVPVRTHSVSSHENLNGQRDHHQHHHMNTTRSSQSLAYSDSSAGDDNNSKQEEDCLSDTVKIKLADFGMAGFVSKDGLLRGRCGTPGYVAPDIFHAGMHEGYSINVDMFSVSSYA